MLRNGKYKNFLFGSFVQLYSEVRSGGWRGLLIYLFMRETRLPGLFPGRCFAKGPLISASITLPLSGTYLYASQPAVSCPTHPRKKSLCFNINNNVRHVVILLMWKQILKHIFKQASKQNTLLPGAPSRVTMHLNIIYICEPFCGFMHKS